VKYDYNIEPDTIVTSLATEARSRDGDAYHK